jgi:hypothetical protein
VLSRGLRKIFAVLCMAGLLVTCGVVSASAGVAKAERVQERVNRYLAEIPGSRQVSANKILIPGGELNVGLAKRRGCSYGWLCTWKYDNGFDEIDYYYCGRYSLPNWIGRGGYENNQTTNTYAEFDRRDGSAVRVSYAYDFYDNMDWTPIWYVEVC